MNAHRYALEHPIMDALTRRARMRGFDALWLPGMDHASIAVHALVEKALLAVTTALARRTGNPHALGLAETLLDRDYQVVGIDNLPGASPPLPSQA